MSYLLSFNMTYMACAVLYHCGRRRSALPAMRRMGWARAVGYTLSWVLMAWALQVTATPQGWERGVPIWLGILTLAGMCSLILATLVPRAHLWSLLLAALWVAATVVTVSM
ncbi:MAG: hypothetical protein AAGA91_14725 [Pseudomonadota bacterium]